MKEIGKNHLKIEVSEIGLKYYLAFASVNGIIAKYRILEKIVDKIAGLSGFSLEIFGAEDGQ